MKYKRLCTGLSDYGRFIPTNESPLDHITDLDKDAYLSVYEYTEEQKELAEEDYQEEDGTIRPRGVRGMKDVITDTLVFDFDIPKHSGLTLEDVKNDTRTMIERLESAGFDTDSIQLTFSGSKGFGVALKLDEYLSPDQHKRIAKKLAEGLKTWDSKVYNSNRILRVPLTKHQKTGLYKTPLDISELSEDIETIQGYATEKLEADQIAPWYTDTTNLPPNVKQMGEKEEDTTPTNNLTIKEKLDLSEKPKWLSNWKYALLNGYFPPGTRNNALMILAATFRGQNLPKEVAGRMLKGAAELQAARFKQDKFEKDEIWGNHIKQVYDDFWNGGTYSEDNFPEELKEYLIGLGIERSTPEEEDELIVGIEEQFKLFDEYAYNIDNNTMQTGIDSLDEKLKMQLGQLIGVLAPPGVGKTSFALTLLNNTSQMEVPSFFGSYDMSGNVLFQKLIQREMDVDREGLYDAYRTEDMERIGRFKNTLAENYEHVTFSFNVGQTINGLKKSIERREEKLGKKIKLVVVDYLELILTKSSDPTQASAEAIQGLREIANEGRVVVVLLQPNKMSSKVDEPLLSYNAAKGSSAVAQACTAILTCHRPGMSSQTPETDRYFSINCVKNRMGELFALDFNWVGRTGRISEMDEMDKDELTDLRKTKRALKELEDDF